MLGCGFVICGVCVFKKMYFSQVTDNIIVFMRVIDSFGFDVPSGENVTTTVGDIEW